MAKFAALVTFVILLAALTGTCCSSDQRAYLESFSLQGLLSFDNTSAVAKDWGHLRQGLVPQAVVYPSAVADIATIVSAVARSDSELTVAARGLGHSINGQAQVKARELLKSPSRHQFDRLALAY